MRLKKKKYIKYEKIPTLIFAYSDHILNHQFICLLKTKVPFLVQKPYKLIHVLIGWQKLTVHTWKIFKYMVLLIHKDDTSCLYHIMFAGFYIANFPLIQQYLTKCRSPYVIIFVRMDEFVFVIRELYPVLLLLHLVKV